MKPTDEQDEVIDRFLFGDPLAVQARAGTGKTTTLVMLGDAARPRRCRYLAFNRSVIADARGRFGDNVSAFTAHSAAFRAVGRPYAHRLQSSRVRSEGIAHMLGIEAITVDAPTGPRTIEPGTLAGLVMMTLRRFCQSEHPRPLRHHTPNLRGIDLPGVWVNNNRVATHIAPAVAAAWRDICDPDGALPFAHDHYLKMWQLSGAPVPAHVILYDEAQDASPVILAALVQQTHAQLVIVGDPEQSIYGFTGAVNAMADIPDDAKVSLTQSFRFGPAIADVANRVLAMLDATPPVIGHPNVPSRVERTGTPDAILCRTNASAVTAALSLMRAGRKVHVVGGATDVISFARAAEQLQHGRRTNHRDLACFATWPEVLDYVQRDPQGADLAMLVALVVEFGPRRLITGLGAGVPEHLADVVISTAHKAKGREWDQVIIGDDFYDPDRDMPDEELRLLYVAATRARHVLDVTRCALLQPDPPTPRRTRRAPAMPPGALGLPAGTA